MNPLSSAGTGSVDGAYQVAVQKKINDAATEQGDAEVKLIQASEPSKAASGHVGTQLHVVA